MEALDQIKTGTFYFDPEDPIYRDHFPGNPVVPGSLIIHAFMETMDRSKGADTGCTATRFRFKQFIPPGRYAFRLKPRPDGRTDCLLFDRDETVVTGVL